MITIGGSSDFVNPGIGYVSVNMNESIHETNFPRRAFYPTNGSFIFKVMAYVNYLIQVLKLQHLVGATYF